MEDGPHRGYDLGDDDEYRYDGNDSDAKADSPLSRNP